MDRDCRARPRAVLYVLCVHLQQEVSAWRPRVAGVVEVFHARFTAHAYPMHVHDEWTLLIVDDGAVDGPDLADPVLRRRVGQLHRALTSPGDEFEAESRLALIGERLHALLQPRLELPGDHTASHRVSVPHGTAGSLRELLDERVTAGLSLSEAAGLLQAHPAHLVRSFSAAFGIAPHQYLISRRVALARRLLLDGRPAAEVAVEAGFHDQSHFTRHFKRLVGTTPGRYARSEGFRH
ncbi:helix-turn-helix transcriptional regulator [Streptomyces goshikiensis]|uniref:helix-turn-helix transcriptional regulator n=1 Tax=Streptomyces goshikiensis TaxID=1942 RepID=UPI0037F7A1E6